MQDEAQLQSQFLNAVLDKRQPMPASPFLQLLHADSLQAYRGNFSAIAQRAMAAMYPKVLHYLGEEDFDRLVHLHVQAHPPLRGDWAQYGGEFATWIHQANPGGIDDALPWLAELARLEHAIYHCESAVDETLDAPSLNLLTHDARALRLALQQHVKLVACTYPILDIYHGNTDALPSPQAHLICVWRSGWRAQLTILSAGDAAFVRFCSAGATVEEALSQAVQIDPQFDLATWLGSALQQQLIHRIYTEESTP